MMLERWKLPHILKGMLTGVPLINAWRLRRASEEQTILDIAILFGSAT